MTREEVLKRLVDNLERWPTHEPDVLHRQAPDGWRWSSGKGIPFLYREGDDVISRRDWEVAKNSAGVNHDLKSLANATHSQLKTRTEQTISAINATLDATPEASRLIYLSSRALEAMHCGDIEVAKHCIEMVMSDEA